MATNILNLPQFSSAAFALANNAAWLDSIYFAASGYPGPVQVNGCATVIGSNIVTVPTTTAGISVGMQISGTPNFPSASYIGAILTPTTFTLVDVFGNQLNATATNVEVAITFNPPPLDLTGIGFVANLRIAAGSAQVFLVAHTGNGTLVNGGKIGTLSFNVPRQIMQSVPAGSYVMDILAADATTVINLFPQIPATVTIFSGVADIATLTGTLHP
jgi:hypothetical protein